MVTLPSQICTGVGFAATVGSAACLRQSFTAFSNILRDPEITNSESPSLFQNKLVRLLGQRGSTLSGMARDALEGLFWAASSVAFAALAMVALDPKGKYTPSERLKPLIPLKHGPSLNAADFASRLSPFDFTQSLGHMVQSLARGVHTAVSYIVPFVRGPAPCFTSAPVSRLHYEAETYLGKDMADNLPWIAVLGYLFWNQRGHTQALSALKGNIAQLTRTVEGFNGKIESHEFIRVRERTDSRASDGSVGSVDGFATSSVATGPRSPSSTSSAVVVGISSNDGSPSSTGSNPYSLPSAGPSAASSSVGGSPVVIGVSSDASTDGESPVLVGFSDQMRGAPPDSKTD